MKKRIYHLRIKKEIHRRFIDLKWKNNAAERREMNWQY
ncbi:hypothetical protein CHCC14820_0524 [Bacillus paralicheniformis]|uniref:Uncharacterized protein n=1 Tax=Bacillus paralicheniformis TaxID=1648923 RepID=A0A7Z0WZJ0_9BACI|nr:hypothetical protein B4121_1492 [Bacillus paralicheniformis]TWK26517.1 hypothetical protein CHCC20372_1561 [Bacillus paralicheniformis]TWK38395.1 hypothetical protein CHCC20348_3807 [Bacillus paralicheniformis]TWK38816.1 hypothetical protein CHCC20347_4075 [Bacillus paralicheniformis]TWK81693.1 hypothetical protein CHCC20331_4166 [Bacillus paralicheniformis]